MEWIAHPWPWYVAGPLIGLVVPALLLFGGKTFGVSTNLRHLCAATLPGRLDFLRYDWKKSGLWNLTFIVGVALGGLLSVTLLGSAEPVVAISAAIVRDLQALGGTLFGVGWALTGACPGPIFALLGAGVEVMLVTRS